MIKLERTAVMNFENAVRGARNPLNSWEKSDSYINEDGGFVLGENDKELCKKLCKAGGDHRKFMRQIFVSVDITAPLYWWKEFDTYKVGTVANSCSTMHKLTHKEFELDDFSKDRMSLSTQEVMECVIQHLELLRKHFLVTKDRQDWDDMIQLLPSSYNQLRTITMNYENIFNMHHARKNHKLDEWREGFTEWVESLPYARELITEVQSCDD